MMWIDWVLLAVLFLSALLGLWRGLVYEVISVAGWVLAFVLAQAYARDATAWLPLDGFSAPLQLAAGFAVVFLAAAFAGGLVAWLVKKLVESVGLRPVDRVLGGVFGLVRGVVILLGVAVVVSMTPLHQQGSWQASHGAGALSATLHQVKPLLPESVAQYLP
ncbi:MAG: CvpA family protein [Hydrogenophaga sp.]|uniref:CvpA family protein n=1 Tax=Hydrogenophaga sp. TaxID=1904254 RepID=UPI002ABBA6F3|nr:CvpA family protein [Hydrogenophaga sp.]MDZ4187216.1 CvpA family protein [Hydrogenophaga sp.]